MAAIGVAKSRMCHRRETPRNPMAENREHAQSLIHGYDEVDYSILRDALTLNLPELLAQLERAIAAE